MIANKGISNGLRATGDPSNGTYIMIKIHYYYSKQRTILKSL